ncbi:hypothetical protein [Enterovirga rhinocerotis]|uniref:Uncharacterized protein n=1 Tax=Enterovirga rhinocerotis TaxID=1339210 RepID=A0A4R7C6H2_9HYPH|nr:hypothetical protein [Enterovirga rhinocerotis]TDR94180.1 hypothetical protein EV668_1458 [Enterovirga rhinocerotis]
MSELTFSPEQLALDPLELKIRPFGRDGWSIARKTAPVPMSAVDIVRLFDTAGAAHDWLAALGAARDVRRCA